MRVYIDREKLFSLMERKGVKKLSELCRNAGVDYKGFRSNVFQRGRMSAENYWLIADYLGCHVEEIQKVDWTI